MKLTFIHSAIQHFTVAVQPGGAENRNILRGERGISENPQHRPTGRILNNSNHRRGAHVNVCCTAVEERNCSPPQQNIGCTAEYARAEAAGDAQSYPHAQAVECRQGFLEHGALDWWQPLCGHLSPSASTATEPRQTEPQHSQPAQGSCDEVNRAEMAGCAIGSALCRCSCIAWHRGGGKRERNALWQLTRRA